MLSSIAELEIMFSFMFVFISILFIPSGWWLCLMLEVYLFVESSSFQATYHANAFSC